MFFCVDPFPFPLSPNLPKDNPILDLHPVLPFPFPSLCWFLPSRNPHDNPIRDPHLFCPKWSHGHTDHSHITARYNTHLCIINTNTITTNIHDFLLVIMTYILARFIANEVGTHWPLDMWLWPDIVAIFRRREIVYSLDIFPDLLTYLLLRDSRVLTAWSLVDSCWCSDEDGWCCCWCCCWWWW